MDWLKDQWPVLLLLALYTLLMVYHAWVGQRRTNSLVDYFIGGRSIGGVAIAISFFATFASTNSFVGAAGQGYTHGVAWLFHVPFVVILSAASWIFIAPRLRSFTERLDSITVPDFIGFRFDSSAARLLAALIVLLSSFLYMTAIYKGIGNLLGAYLEIRYGAAIFLVVIIVVAYTTVGGFHSVVKTDVTQGIIMIIAAVLLFGGVMRAAGGPGAFFELRDAPETAILFDWNAATPLPLLLGVLFATSIKFIVEPRQLSRFYALENAAAARRGMWISTGAFLLVFGLLTPIGMMAHSVLGEGVADTDEVVPMLLSGGEVFHWSVSAFLLLAMISAAMSSLDSVLLVMASTFQRDVMQLLGYGGGEKAALKFTRLYVFVFASITALLALNPPGGIIALTSFSGSLYGVCFAPAIVLGLYWRRGNGSAVIASYVVGMGCLFLWRFLPLSSVIHPVFPGLLLSIAVYVAVALNSKPNTSPVVQGLFNHPDAA